MTRGAAIILDRLDRVKQTGPGRWLAKCPAHEDNSPSLSIRELDDGRVLLHDFGGCDTQTVLDSLGLEMRALFPERLAGSAPGGGYASTHSRIPAADVLVAIDHEVLVATVILSDVMKNRKINEAQMVRLTQAAARIGSARDMARPAEVRCGA